MTRHQNSGSLDFAELRPRTDAYHWNCNEGCRVVMPDAARIGRTRETRWGHLDGARDDEAG